MHQGLRNELEATHKYLSERIRDVGDDDFVASCIAHAKSLIAKIKRSHISIDLANDLVATLREGVWPNCIASILLETIDEQVVQGSSQTLAVVSRTQSLLYFDAYLTKDIKSTLECAEPFASKLMKVARFVVTLGCAHPSEQSIKQIVGVIMLMAYGKQGVLEMEPASRHAHVVQFKQCLKMCGKSSTVAGLLDYPADPNDLPRDLFNRVYSSDPPLIDFVDANDLAEVLTQIPLRKTNKAVATEAGMRRNSFEAQSMMQMMAAVCNQFAVNTRPQELLINPTTPRRPLAIMGAASDSSTSDRRSHVQDAPTPNRDAQPSLQHETGSSQQDSYQGACTFAMPSLRNSPRSSMSIEQLEAEMDSALKKNDSVQRSTKQNSRRPRALMMV